MSGAGGTVDARRAPPLAPVVTQVACHFRTEAGIQSNEQTQAAFGA